MLQDHIKNIIIVGGGTAGWMAAAACANRLPTQFCQITLIESDAIATVGVGESTLPHIRQFNETLGIDENTFIKKTRATVKLGIRFNDWGDIGQSYIHPFGEHGEITRGIEFHHYWLKAKHAGQQHRFEDHSIAATAAESAKFPISIEAKKTKFSDYNYSYHIDASAYATFLREYAVNKGVTRIEGKITQVQKHQNGYIKSVQLENGRFIEADIFIDCSGFRALLIDKEMASPFIDWSHWLLTDSAIAVPCERSGDFKPYTQATARPAGWQWQIPLQHRIGNGHAFSSQFMEQQQALDILMDSLPNKATAEPKLIRYTAGRRQASWIKNCVAIGLSTGFIEPLESTSIYLIQLGINKFLELLPSRVPQQANIDEYNKAINHSYDIIRDFIILHFHVNQRNDSEFWRYCRNMTIPDSLAHLLSLFSESGRTDLAQFGVWPAVCIGQNIIPKYYDARLDNIDQQQILHYLEQNRQSIQQMVAQFPTADQFVSHKLSQYDRLKVMV